MPALTVRTDPGLASELRLGVMRLARRLRLERSDDAMSLNQLAVMGTLERHGRLTVGQLAAHEKVRPPSMTRTVACLQESGHVQRAPHETDGRQVVVELTELGRVRVLADRRRRDAWMAQRLKELTKAERDVLRAAAPILDRLAAW
ncbi:MAG: MarR family transcriptional regulator [Actinomycetes bacterium]